MKERTYQVSGMHCASCELVIEKKLLELSGIQAVEASVARGQVVIEYEGQEPQIKELNRLFSREKYQFFNEKKEKILDDDYSSLTMIIVVSLVILGFVFFNWLGFTKTVRVDSTSSLLVFFVLGMVAGVSSCAALVGGMVLSMSKQWLELYSHQDSTFQKLTPHLLFNFGRIVSYGVFGAVLGTLGSKLAISFGFTSFLVIAVSFLMLFLGLQMLGVGYFQKFQISMPKIFTRYVADERNFRGRQMPFLMGALTFFLPCGFTITAQGLALLSGNAFQGALIMLVFVLGTTSPLLMIGFSSIKFGESHRFSAIFPKVAGVLVLFFALFNLNNQLNVLGFPSFGNISLASKATQSQNQEDLALLVSGKQLLKMNASSRGYQPNYFKVKVNVPVRWEVTDTGTSGCTNAIISKSLFDGQIDLTPGQVSVKEFTPTKIGKYKFSCWMGMVTGTIEVVDLSVSSLPALNAQETSALPTEVPSGAQGCGCAGGK